MVMFNSYVSHYQRVMLASPQNASKIAMVERLSFMAIPTRSKTWDDSDFFKVRVSRGSIPKSHEISGNFGLMESDRLS